MARPFAAAILLSLLVAPEQASAQVVEVTVFTGRAFPLYEERLTVSPSALVLPGVDVTATGSQILSADGGAVFGAAIAVGPARFGGRFGIEGRLDATDVALEFTGGRYDFRGTAFPFQGLTAGLIVSPGRFDADRISLLSLNARIRTRGRTAFIASGGVSYLPKIDISGSIPLTVDAPDLSAILPGLDAAVALRATPGQSGHRFGINGGAGVRAGGRLAFTGEVRAFYFREFDLRLTRAHGPELLDTLLSGADAIGFSPVFVNAQIGLAWRF
jgi:hypothetical protein